ncbi:response regulator receiver [Fulvivirga imtechensis AK7]|uniref:Response regulator receiver n=1 Tax=Fulvivirga imtechensis AK7 TaxID=1237149 RepID=L8JHU0_9BACT|nr:response regulator [Fulvivirga imtechensis]ELR68385.1 response regulator receiver [Fulvivirga imtechensis AK7]
MEKIKMLIVEDQLLIAQDIAGKLEDNGIEVLDICVSGEEALKLLETTQADLILMDIELAGAMDGISTANIIKEQYSIPVIYLSDHTDDKLVERAKKTLPVNYLSKPFQERDLIRAIEIASYNNMKSGVQKRSLNKDYVFLKENQQFVKIAYDDILYLQADRAYSQVITKDKLFTFSSNMKNIYEQIDHPAFLRVHRSYVVNLNRITAIDGNVLKLGDKSVQMSKEYRDDILNQLKLVK